MGMDFGAMDGRTVISIENRFAAPEWHCSTLSKNSNSLIPNELRSGRFTTSHSPGPAWLPGVHEGEANLLKAWRSRACFPTEPPGSIRNCG